MEAGSATRIALVGRTPRGLASSLLGVFEELDERVNDSPAYAHLEKRDIVLWRARGCWVVGARADVGSLKGDLRVRPGPFAATAKWYVIEEVVPSDELHRPPERGDAGNGAGSGASSDDSDEETRPKHVETEAPNVRCLNSDALEAEHAAAATHCALAGSTPGHCQRECLGLFEMCAQLVHGYPCYAQAGAARDKPWHLWHCGGQWIVGRAEDVGGAIGGLHVVDSAYRPEHVTSIWLVLGANGSSEWVEAPEVHCLFGERLDHELNAAPRVVILAGERTDRRGNPQKEGSHRDGGKGGDGLGVGGDDWVGIFEKLPERIHALPTYALKVRGAHSEALMWHAGSFWWVGSVSSAEKKMLRACDGALRPDKVEASWEIWEVEGERWVDAPTIRCGTRE